MSERKVLNKYYPPDFDPSKIPRRKQPKDKQEIIRLMAPFSMRCKQCGHYIGVGKKFNGRKETVQNESYLGLKIFRLYFKCPMCSSEITIKTDPRNSDYTVEHGVTRNFEPWRDAKKEEDEGADPLAHIIAEEGLDASDDDLEDPMKALEQRQEESRREMEVMDALQDIRTRNARLDRVDTEDVMSRLEQKAKAKLTAEELEQQRLEEEDEKLVQRHFGRDMAAPPLGGASNSAITDASASPSPETPGSSEAPQPAVGRSIKRLHADVDEEEAFGNAKSLKGEPDIHSVLSEKAREQLLSATTKVSPGLAARTTSAVPKRKKQANAFGIVRKKT